MWCAEDPDAWKGAPVAWLDCVFGVGIWVTDREVQQEIGPEFLMYWQMLASFT